MQEELLDAMDGIACAVDAENRIIAVGHRRWDRFAVENGAPDLCADKIIGCNLFEFVGGSKLWRAYRKLSDRVIATGESAAATMRCDSPGIAGELCLSISPLRLGDKGQGLLFQIQIFGERTRPRLDISDFKTLLSALRQETDLPIVTMCSFCRLVRRPGSPGSNDGEDDWVTAEEYYRLGDTSRVRISHGICADCDAARFPDL